MRPALRHLPVILFFGALTFFFTWPLARHLTSGVLGEASDNLNFVWDFWWARTAIHGSERSLFWTPDLFAPFGTSLAVHTLVPLLSAGAAWLAPTTPPLTLYNVALVVSVFLNFACAYSAAYITTRDRAASAFAAVVFGGAPFLIVRLLGHLNVLSAWVLPLLLIAAWRYRARPTVGRALGLGGTMALLAYVDYYYLIFGALLVALDLLLSQYTLRVRARPLTPARRRTLVGIGVAAAIVMTLIAWIAVTGGTDTTIAGVRLRMTDTFNDRVALGFLALLAWLIWSWPAVTMTPLSGQAIDRTPWRRLPIAAGAAAILMSPLFLAAWQLWRAGDYSSQAYVWRNAPGGIDLATLFLGNQLNVLTGGWTTGVYERFDISRMESATWIGLAPAAMLAFAIWRLRSRPDAQKYLWIGGLFFVWALGPYVRILGANTGAMLPQTLLRFLPIISNARVPGRAFIVVQLMVAILGAMAVASIRRSHRRGHAIAAVAIAATLADYWPVAFPWMAVNAPAMYRTLRDAPPGVVLEIPLGIRDGFGARGALDHRVLFYQTVHEHPQMGGAISRLSKRIQTAYETDPIVGPLLDLSERRPPAPDSRDAGPCRSSLVCQVRYVVLDRTEASDELQRFVASAFSLEAIEQDASRTLYAVRGVPACTCGQ